MGAIVCGSLYGGPTLIESSAYQIQKLKLVLSPGSTERQGDGSGLQRSRLEKCRFLVKAAFKVWSLGPTLNKIFGAFFD